MFHQMCDVHRHLNNLPEKIIQPSLFFEHLQAQVQLHMASEGRNVSASLLLLFFVLENAWFLACMFRIATIVPR